MEKIVKLRILDARSATPAPKTAQQDDVPDTYEREKTAELTQLAARSIRKRLKAAGIKDYSVTSAKSRSIVVRVRGNISRGVVAGIVVPRGRLELRPIEPSGERWVRALGYLPAGVMLRQKDGSLDAAQAYLWSADPGRLRAALASLKKLPVGSLNAASDAPAMTIYPADGGWRTLALGPPIATHEAVASASIRQGKTGEPYVQLLFQNNLSDAFNGDDILGGDADLWAIMLDGEVVSVLSGRAHNLGHSLNIKAPETLHTRQARLAWAQQVAGRLAAYIPIPLIEDGVAPPAK